MSLSFPEARGRCNIRLPDTCNTDTFTRMAWVSLFSFGRELRRVRLTHTAASIRRKEARNIWLTLVLALVILLRWNNPSLALGLNCMIITWLPVAFFPKTCSVRRGHFGKTFRFMFFRITKHQKRRGCLLWIRAGYRCDVLLTCLRLFQLYKDRRWTVSPPWAPQSSGQRAVFA